MKVLLAACLAAVAVTNGVVPAAAADRTAVLKANPKHVNFGTKAVGTFTVKGSTITNIGSSDVLVQTSAVQMPDQFSWGLLPGQTCPIFSPEILAAGASCDVVAGFRPEEFFVGREDTAVLQVTATHPLSGATLGAVLVEFRGVGKS
jgi:archaellum component FlaF (FlaF/FlaG flagellin family)